MTTKTERMMQLRLKWAVEDYPWLADLLRDGDLWVRDDGSITVRYRVEDYKAALPGMRALASALGQELTEIPPGEPLPPMPAGPPLRLGEVRAALGQG